MTLVRCIARSKKCEDLPKKVKPRRCSWMDWHKIESKESCPWANFLCKKKGDRRVQIRFMVEVKGASNTFGEAYIEEEKHEDIKEDKRESVQSDSRRNSKRKDKAKVASEGRCDAVAGGTRYLGQAEARAEIAKLFVKGKK